METAWRSGQMQRGFANERFSRSEVEGVFDGAWGSLHGASWEAGRLTPAIGEIAPKPPLWLYRKHRQCLLREQKCR